MGYIYYRLDTASSLQAAVPTAQAGGAFSNAQLPPGMANFSGMYIIINCNGALHNRYIGIAGNLDARFRPRMSAITELGFAAAMMTRVYAIWGTVRALDYPLGPAIQTVPTQTLYNGPMIPFPQWNAMGNDIAPPQGGAFTHLVDGHNINLEHLLIRFVMMRLGAGGTVSNNMLMRPFAHPGGNPLNVKFEGAALGPYYPAWAGTDVLNPNFQW
jgi:hypothetical protein